MTIFAISDLHLPGGYKKTMDVFGAHWANHWEKIQTHWHACVQEDDIVLIPGDISWAMQLKSAQGDLAQISALPGRKILLRGNHDYWWSSISQVRASLKKGCYALQNDALLLDGFAFCGTRGWTCPTDENLGPADEKIYQREAIRMRLALEDAQRKSRRIIAMIHYPPFNERQDPSLFTDLLEEFSVRHVVYGHLHGYSLHSAFEGILRGVRYHQVSCDHLQFQLYPLDLE